VTFKIDLDRVRLNQRIKYLGQRSFRSQVIVRIHTPDRVLYLDH